MWKIKQIAEADFGCEERMPGEKLKCLVILEDESGNVRCLETEDEWLTEQGLDEAVNGKTERNFDVCFTQQSVFRSHPDDIFPGR